MIPASTQPSSICLDLLCLPNELDSGEHRFESRSGPRTKYQLVDERDRAPELLKPFSACPRGSWELLSLREYSHSTAKSRPGKVALTRSSATGEALPRSSLLPEALWASATTEGSSSGRSAIGIGAGEDKLSAEAWFASQPRQFGPS